ncbi:MAG: hypothetical protein ABL958_02125 [Bdellovibrionia bacterium]
MARKIQEFFLVVVPGLEELATAELKLKWARLNQVDSEIFGAEPKVTPQKGGLLIQADLAAGWVLNSHLKIPSRILQRVDRFKAKDFPKLYNKLKKFPWNKFFREGTVEVKVASSSSRLKIKDRIRETAMKAIRDAQTHQSFRKPHLDVPQTLFLRLQDDEAVMSVDTSGDKLHLRGYKPHTVAAPLRETLAAAFYMAAISRLKTDPAVVLDPMCGSGTILFEANAFWKANSKRRFACQNFPYGPDMMTSDFRKVSIVPSNVVGWGFDKERTAIEAARQNADIFGDPSIHFDVGEMEKLTWKDQGRPLVLLTNPPYNERLKADHDEIADGLNRLVEKIKPDIAGVIWPGERSLASLGGKPLLDETHTTNGGLPITMAIY